MNNTTIAPLVRRLDHYMKLSDEEQQVVADATTQVIRLGKREDIISEGERPDDVHLLLEGWACRYKISVEGNYHIMAYLIPGDLCDVHITLLDQMDHSIRTFSPARIACIPRRKIEHIMEHHPRLARALFWSTLVDEATLREWLVNLGTRSAEKRLAHLLCELLVRSRAAGLTQDNSFDMPVTQAELGESMGLTSIHTNRVIQRLREEGLITFESRRVTIHHWERMTALSEFNPNYLHLERATVP